MNALFTQVIFFPEMFRELASLVEKVVAMFSWQQQHGPWPRETNWNQSQGRVSIPVSARHDDETKASKWGRFIHHDDGSVDYLLEDVTTLKSAGRSEWLEREEFKHIRLSSDAFRFLIEKAEERVYSSGSAPRPGVDLGE